MKKCIAVVAFAVIFLAAVFLFIRNYPSDRWFSVVFIVAGGVLAWCAGGAEAEAGAAGAVAGAQAVADEDIEPTETAPVDTTTK